MAAESADFYARLRKKAFALQPRGKGPILAGICLEALADDEIDYIDDLEENDFLWVNCKPTTRVSQFVKTATAALADAFPETKSGFHLTCDGIPLGPDSLENEIDIPADNFVVLLAKEGERAVLSATRPNGQPASQPIQPPAPYVKSEPQEPENGLPCAPEAPNSVSEQQANSTATPARSHTPVDSKDRILSDTVPEEDEKPVQAQLQHLFETADIATMENGIKAGVDLLDKLKGTLTTEHESEDAVMWSEQIAKVRAQAEYQRTIVGVVGNTGAGKSSVINALLDEERLVPTNCMRACTAVVTEISYNHETDDPYRAKIEFITKEDWAKELRVLFQDLLDGGGEVRRTTADSEAGIAWAKIKGVYPKKTKDQIARSNVEDLLADAAVQNILGKTRVIDETDSLRFYKQLQRFVDSQEKTGDKDKRPKEPEMDYWPLIRVVKLYVKSEALKTGCVVVDLPGVHDANAARAAVADQYMQKCTGLWIVAPITRAVDDKTAHKLMGEGFRRQLLMDGGYSSMSFICSKSDDISISEAMLSLHLEEELEPQSTEVEQLEQQVKGMKNRRKELEAARRDIQAAADELDGLLDKWEKMKDEVEAGKEVYAPKPRKRKRSNDSSGRGKRAKHSDDDTIAIDSDNDDDVQELSDDDTSVNESEDGDKGELLTMEAIGAKIDELKTTKKEGREEKKKLNKEILEVKSDINDLEDRKKILENKMAAHCIIARNKYSASAIQHDFASGLEEMDREAAEEREGENFDPDVQLRDYDEVAKQLPVYCVSSRGYQKLCGRLKKDGDPPVFQDKDQTGIPQLQTACTKFTEKGRLASGRRFLTNLSQLCNSLSLWSMGDSAASLLSDTDKAREVRMLDKKFGNLDDKLDKTIEGTISELKEELGDAIFDKYEDAVRSAAELATITAEKWGEKVNRTDPSSTGLYWATYKAIVRRDGGPFSNARGTHDFNAQLTEPMIKYLASSWERVFSQRIPKAVQQYWRNSKDHITSFHKEVQAQSVVTGVGIGHIHLLAGQLSTYGDIFKNAGDEVTNFIIAAQREISREFVPTVQAVMIPAHRWCTAASGPGQFMRMKARMREHIFEHKYKMFEESCGRVKGRLNDIIKQVEARLEETTMAIYQIIERDYRAIFGGKEKKFTGGHQGRLEKELKQKVKGALVGFEDPFRELLDLPGPEDFDDNEEPDPLPKREPTEDSKMPDIGGHGDSQHGVGTPQCYVGGSPAIVKAERA